MRLVIIFLALNATFSLLGSPVSQTGDVFVPPSNAKLVYTGRFTKDYRFGWTGCAISIHFTGTALAANLKLISGNSSAMEIIVDGVPIRPIFLKKNKDRYTLASHLTPGVHTVEIFKRTEAAPYGEIKFGGFILSSGAKIEHLAPKRRKILVIGDSITCGFGNESKSPNHINGLRIENGYMSYAAIAARRVDAEIMMICWSGRGLYRNYYINHDRQGTLPELFDRTLPLEAEPKWNQRNYIPQLIIINLGTNDLNTDEGRKASLTPREFLSTYDKFLNHLHNLFPHAKVLAAIGPIVDSPISGWIRTLPEKFHFVHILIFPDKNRAAEDIGGGRHPSVLGDIKMADELTPVIRTFMHWK